MLNEINGLACSQSEENENDDDLRKSQQAKCLILFNPSYFLPENGQKLPRNFLFPSYSTALNPLILLYNMLIKLL